LPGAATHGAGGLTNHRRMRCAPLFALSLIAACGGADPAAAPDAAAPDGALAPDAAAAPDAAPDAAIAPGCPHGSRVVYLNTGGGTFSPATNDDSSTNASQIVRADATLPGWANGPAEIAALEACLATNFARYDVRFTRIDPGAAEHVEVVLTDSTSHPGLPYSGNWPVATPFSDADCAPIRRAIVIARPAFVASTADLCVAVSFGIAGAHGLDRIYNAASLMSVLAGTGPRSFLDSPEPCGDFAPRTCRCGGDTQNSHQRLIERLGACPAP